MDHFDENEFYKKATINIFSDLEVGQALENILSFLVDYIPADALSLVSSDEQNNCLINHATSRPSSWRAFPEKIYFPDELRDITWKGKNNLGKFSIINDMEKLPKEYQKILSAYMMPNTSCLRMSLVSKGFHLGSLLIFAEGKNRYTDVHIQKIELLTAPFTMAFANILHHKEVLLLKGQLENENTFLKTELLGGVDQHIVGADFGLKQVMQTVQQAAPTESTIMILGETGVGKELVANAIHRNSRRRNATFIKLNCGAIPETLIDSELFGHEKGAFTGALQRKLGRFERANGGTIFLDEIGELPMSAQSRLLRVIQNKEFERVGGTKTISVDARVIAATHRDLHAMVRQGEFREDLYYRLSVLPIMVPPLRERIGDLPELIEFISDKKAVALNMHSAFRPGAEEFERMKSYDWPGNVRELENYIERQLITSGSSHFSPASPNAELKPNASVESEILPLDQVVMNHLERVLAMTGGKIEGEGGASELLELNPSTLRGKMRKLGINFRKKKAC